MFFVLYVIGWASITTVTYMVPVHHVWLWFPNSPGLATGILIGGFGLGALIFDPISTLIINPNNLAQINGQFP